MKNNRQMHPRIIECKEDSPNERIIKSRLNPNENTKLENFSTDDLPLNTFMNYITELIVNED